MFAEGAVVGSYRVLRRLGRGGMGAVFAAEHALLGRQAAIKVLLPAMSADPELVQRLFNEARAVALIADPGIVQVFDFGHHTDGSAFIVMELLEGETVEHRLRRIARLPPGDAVRLIRQVCASLSAAHAKGIVHRDLKPENIFIVGDPAVPGGERTKLLDFGVAKLTHGAPGDPSTRSGQLMGTPLYMSPEQCRDAHAADHRSDVYSIGCVLMKMLTGAAPFAGDGMGDLIVAHVCQVPPRARDRVPELPEALDRIVARCLAKPPDDRYPSMAELAEALDAVEPRPTGFAGPTLAMPAAAPFDGEPRDTTIDRASGGTSASGPRGPRLRTGRARWTTLAIAAIAAAAIAAAAIAVTAARRDSPAGEPSPPLAAEPAMTPPAGLPPVASEPTTAAAADAAPAAAPPATTRTAPPRPRHRAERKPRDHGLPPVGRDD
jgi:serine/threonine-protein kinase